jgi:malyl-CoA/(S)-citramalyl-CoA lyase
MPDGTGVALVDGKMLDDATRKQAKVIVDLARLVASREPEMKAAYGL